MKKLMIVAAMAIVAAGFTACGNSTPKANLKSDIDTLSYALGMANTQGLKDYLVQSLGMDTAYMADFVKGLNEGVSAGENKKKAAYYIGIQIGQQVSNQMMKNINHSLFGNDSTKTISTSNFMAGFITAALEKKGLMTVDSAQVLAQVMMQQVKARELEKVYGENKAEGEKFLVENAKKDGVVTLPSGVQYKIEKEGTGAIPADTSLVRVNYEGRLLNDTIFDSSYKRGTPAMFRANQVIKGWTEILTHMPEGSVWEIYIPQELAYGEREQGEIKPFSMLIFKLELLEANAKRK